jgi:hypothetical protein
MNIKYLKKTIVRYKFRVNKTFSNYSSNFAFDFDTIPS